MKYVKYEKPDLEEIELQLEGSFLDGNSIPGEKNDDNEIDNEDDFL